MQLFYPFNTLDRGFVIRRPQSFVRAEATSSRLLLGIAMGFTSAMGFLFVLLISRVLGPSDFGAFSALNNIGLVLAIPAGAFQVVIASGVARRGAVAFDLGLPLIIGTAGVLVTALLSPAIAHVTRVESAWTPAILGLGLLPLILSGAFMGGLLGLSRFGALSCAYLFAGSSRMLSAWVADVLDAGLNESLSLIVVANCATTLLLWWLSRRQAHVRLSRLKPPRLDVVRMLFRSSSSVGVLMALTSVDVVLARYVLSEIEAGEYALVATLGRAPVWITQFLALSMVPALARSGSSRAILRAVTPVLGICALGAGVAAINPEMWIVLLGGRAYDDAAGLLLSYLAFGTLLAVVQVFIVAEMTQGRHLLTKVAWGAMLMQVVLCLLFFRDNAFQLLGAAVVAAGCVLLFGVLEFFIRGARRHEPRDSVSVSDGT